MRRFLTSAIAAGALLIGGTAWAHHPFAAEYDANKPAKLEGKVTKVEWTNPHAFLTVEGKADDGKAERWRARESERPHEAWVEAATRENGRRGDDQGLVRA